MRHLLTIIVGFIALGKFANVQAFEPRADCLPTEPGKITWTLPTTPTGPTWSISTGGMDASHIPAQTSPFQIIFWRRPCNATDSQLLMTLKPETGRPAFGMLQLFQHGSNPSFLYAVNDPEAYLFTNSIIHHQAINKAVTLIIDGFFGNEALEFNPNQSFSISYLPHTYPLSAPISLNIPPYNPAEYNLNNASNAGITPPNAKMGGMYYDPNQSGEGWQLTFGTSNGKPTLVATWYTYEGGKQLWLLGIGNYDSTSTSITLPMLQTTGADFGAAFKAADVQTAAWGDATLQWLDCNTLHIDYQRQDGLAGDQTLTRFFYNPADASCP